MRFYEFKHSLKEQDSQVFVIGDSHARAIGGTNNLASDGATLSAIQQQAGQVPEGSTVYMTGGHNDVAAGSDPQTIARQVAAIVTGLESQGSAVRYILFPEGTNNTNQENMDATRRAIQGSVTVAQDLEGSPMQQDGIHAALSVYRSIDTPPVQSVQRTAGPDDGTRGTEEPQSQTNTINAGPPYPPSDLERVAQMQSKLEEIGYSVGNTGIDGKYGPRTANAVRAFKNDYELDGTPFEMNSEALSTLEGVVSGEIERVSAPTQVAQISGDIGDLAQDSVTQGKVGGVLDLIAGPESAGRYDAVYPSRRRSQILDMTLDELYRDMAARGERYGSSASGRYQYIRTTLQEVAQSMGLDTATTVFDPETQDSIAIYHLRLSHGLDNWLAGRMSNEDFLARLSRTWAGIPDPATGGSYYAGVLDNRAGIRVNSAIEQLDAIQRA